MTAFDLEVHPTSYGTFPRLMCPQKHEITDLIYVGSRMQYLGIAPGFSKFRYSREAVGPNKDIYLDPAL